MFIYRGGHWNSRLSNYHENALSKSSMRMPGSVHYEYAFVRVRAYVYYECVHEHAHASKLRTLINNNY